tara:strand:- start:12 stop:743 length:732 start_codon:yes stop_codon:yes gene_type:complete
MSIFDTLEKRHHVLKYKPEIVPDKTLKDLLRRAWKISPSKNNFMPYQVSVLGPYKQAEKNKIYNKVVYNHKFYDEMGLEKDTHANPKMQLEYTFEKNPNYAHVRHNSHLIIFSSRVCPEPNKFYQRMIKNRGHFAEQCEIEHVKPTAESTSFEVGLFASNLTTLCIENGIDISYTACLPKNEHKWKDTPYLWYDKENEMAKVHSIMSIGYGDYYRYQWLKEHHKVHIASADKKPQPEEVIKWI